MSVVRPVTREVTRSPKQDDLLYRSVDLAQGWRRLVLDRQARKAERARRAREMTMWEWFEVLVRGC